MGNGRTGGSLPDGGGTNKVAAIGAPLAVGGGALKLDKDVEFKVTGLDLTQYLSGPLQGYDRISNSSTRRNGVEYDCRPPIFNLYGCVCHFGSVYGGHYTSYSKHLTTGQVTEGHDCSIY